MFPKYLRRNIYFRKVSGFLFAEMYFKKPCYVYQGFHFVFEEKFLIWWYLQCLYLLSPAVSLSILIKQLRLVLMLKYRRDDIIIPFSLRYSSEHFRLLQPWWSLHWKYEQGASDDRNYIRIVHRTITSCSINTLTTIKIKRYFKIKRNTKKQWYVSMAFFICGKFGTPRNEN